MRSAAASPQSAMRFAARSDQSGPGRSSGSSLAVVVDPEEAFLERPGIEVDVLAGRHTSLSVFEFGKPDRTLLIRENRNSLHGGDRHQGYPALLRIGLGRHSSTVAHPRPACTTVGPDEGCLSLRPACPRTTPGGPRPSARTAPSSRSRSPTPGPCAGTARARP